MITSELIKQREINSEERKLVEALRSGEYMQCTGGLCKEQKGEFCYCCLGVYTELCGVAKASDGDGPYYVYRLGEESSRSWLLPQLMGLLGWKTKGGKLRSPLFYKGQRILSLAVLNDSGAPFEYIADVIECGYVLLDTEEETDYNG